MFITVITISQNYQEVIKLSKPIINQKKIKKHLMESFLTNLFFADKKLKPHVDEEVCKQKEAGSKKCHVCRGGRRAQKGDRVLPHEQGQEASREEFKRYFMSTR